MKYVFLLAFASLALFPSSATAKPALCTIQERGATTFSGRCVFSPTDDKGSFSIRKANGRQLVPGVTDVSVFVVTPGTAEVRGLTVNGIHSRWGSATRSVSNPACWQGTDFEICAY
jgi:hypothetical protein